MGEIKKIVRILCQNYGYTEWWGRYTSFETLVSIILSQRTYWKNVKAAMERFRGRFTSPRDVANTSLEIVIETIRPAGLYNLKAPIIQNIARDLVEEYDSDLDGILKLPYDKAKKKLVSIKGIGPKTADVFLMAIKGAPVLPVDVHIFRIMRRLGVANEKDDYEDLRAKLESNIRPKQRRVAHLTLIEFGRQICRANDPRCDLCPIKGYCESEN